MADVDMKKDGADLLDRAQNKRRTGRGGREKSLMDRIRTRQENWIGHIIQT